MKRLIDKLKTVGAKITIIDDCVDIEGVTEEKLRQFLQEIDQELEKEGIKIWHPNVNAKGLDSSLSKQET